MEYPGIQSAFEVFSSKFAKNKKGNTSKTPSPPGGKARVSPARQESAKFKATQNMNGAGLVRITNGAVVAKKKGRKNFATNNGLVDQKKDVINKKRNSTSGTNDMGVVEQLGEQVEIAIATKNKKTKVSLKSKRKLSLVNGSLEKSFEEESVVELPIDKLENYNDLKILTPGPKKKRKVSGETIGSNKSTATVKLKKSTRVLENGMLKETKKQKKGRKELKRRSGDAAESPSTSEAKCPDSVEEGEQLFAWLIDPVTPVDFFRDTWEQRPLVIKRQQPDFYQSLLSTAIIHKMLERDNVQFSKNVDVTTYQNGKRETHNPDGRAFPAVVWSHYNVGCSVRLLNPQTFIPKLHLLNATLQEYFGCLVGANAYLTPPGSQGFAPHYDDIEAFILQLEGQKSWKLYAPMTEDEVLPRFSSNNLSEETIGEPIMEVVLSPGDLLYFPRGTIHQGRTVTDHSLHVTLSCYQRNTWGDLLQKAISAALKYALEEDVELRRGLPRDYLRYMGSVHSDRELPERQAFVERLHGLLGRMFDQLPVDAAADQLGKQFVHDALPPVLTPAEKRCSVFGDGLKMMEKGRLCNHGELELKTKIKLLRAHILRLVVEEEDVVRLYHYVDNSLEYHGNEPQYLELPVEAAPAVELLIRSYPAFVAVASLPLDTDDDKVKLAGDLWERGLLLTDRPLQVVVDE